MASGLDLFHPLIRDWFEESVGTPTEVQEQAWPRIAAGEHVLVTAPTGSGKTLTAFLWALGRLLTGTWPAGQVRVLYVSPLRALNTDIRRNLEQPLAELEQRFRAIGERPMVRAVTRSGDTPPAERRRMLRQPPEILITTPESLNILLTSEGGRGLFTGLATVILDEIHALAGSKRGTHLITAVDRLVRLSGEFQRLALSATIRPLERIAEMVGGWERIDTDGQATYRRRPVSLVRVAGAKTYDLRVRSPLGTTRPEPVSGPPGEGEGNRGDNRWERLTEDLKGAIRGNRSTLLFANSRRLTEKITRFLNQHEREDLAYSHHGSLSREVRAVVEERLKKGELKAIVATNSLELGIDIGALDEVILVQTPRSISSAIQRVGRAGHGVGQVSRARLYPTFGRDFLDAAVVSRCVLEQDIEEIRPIVAPLDVLAQVILSMVAGRSWDLEDLLATLRTSEPFHHLSRGQLDLVLDMLAGRYADSRIRELRPRISIDRVSGTVRSRPGVSRLLYMSGGTIADRGYFSLRLESSMAKIGELDEEFVWERSVGDSFTLGAQSWQIRKITHNDVLVAPARSGSALAPFWRADARDRDFFFSEKIGEFLRWIDGRLDDPGLPAVLASDYRLEPSAAEQLLELLRSQQAATGTGLPHRRHLLVEHTADPHRPKERQMILHTLWGGRVNRPWSMALAAAWEERYAEPLEVAQDDDCLLLRFRDRVELDDVLDLVAPDQVETLLRSRLEQTGFFGSRFRVNASTALLLPKAGFRRRMPLWLNRVRSKKLFDAVRRYGDFPILVETWRTCLQDEFDLESLKKLLVELRDDRIRRSEVRTDSPSPFAANLVWHQTNQLMYEDDVADSGAGASGLRQDLLRELVFSSQLRPRLGAALVERFRRKVQRTAAGYAPRSADELADWIAERLLIPPAEWRELVEAVATAAGDAGGPDGAEMLDELVDRVVMVSLPAAPQALGPVAVALDRLPRILRALGLRPDEIRLGRLTEPGRAASAAALRDLEALLARAPESETDPADELADLAAEWLRYQGPVAPQRLAAVLGLDSGDDDGRLRTTLALLRDSQRVVVDHLTRGAEEPEICDAENLEILLRWMRVEGRPSFEARPAEMLPLFLAHRQGLTEPGDSLEDLQARLDQLLGYPAKAAAWEADFLPARLAPYYPSWLDSLMQETDLLWLGCGSARLTFAFPADLELFQGPRGAGEEATGDGLRADSLFPRPGLRRDLGELADAGGLSTARVSEELWRLAWDGEVSNDTFLAVRKGLESRFKPQGLPTPAGPAARRRRHRRGAFERWQTSRPFHGGWFALETVDSPADALEQEELAKDRVRVLLRRFGIVFRDLVTRELPAMQWSRLFRALRLMELSGEVLAGHFFHGIRGLQFMSRAAFRELRRGLPEDVIFWLNAADPASLCGIEVEGLRHRLPPRKTSTHLVFHGHRVVVVSFRHGKELEVRTAPDHPHLGEYFAFLKVLLTRECRPLASIAVERINDQPAARSPYADRLAELFRTVREPGSLRLWKRYPADRAPMPGAG